MKTDDQIKKAFFEAVSEAQEATEKTVAQACEAVFSKATKQFGPGVYVTGKLNHDAGGISFRFKRPAVRQRVEVFVPFEVTSASQGEPEELKQEDDASNDDTGASGSSQEDSPVDRLVILEAAAGKLNDDDFTSDGRPHVDAVNEQLEEGVEPFTASERDEVWAQRD